MSTVRVRGQGLKGLNKRIQQLPRVVAVKVAKEAAGAITQETQRSFSSGQTVYNTGRPGGLNGPLTLVDTGRTQSQLHFTSDGGTKIRAVLSQKYMRYLIGKYEVLPNGGGARLPTGWKLRLLKIVDSVIQEYLGD